MVKNLDLIGNIYCSRTKERKKVKKRSNLFWRNRWTFSWNRSSGVGVGVCESSEFRTAPSDLGRWRDPREAWCWGTTGQVFWALLKTTVSQMWHWREGVICRGKTDVLAITCVEQRPLHVSMSLGLRRDVETCRVTAEGDNRPGSRFKYSFRLSSSTATSIFYTISDTVLKNKLL